MFLANKTEHSKLVKIFVLPISKYVKTKTKLQGQSRKSEALLQLVDKNIGHKLEKSGIDKSR